MEFSEIEKQLDDPKCEHCINYQDGECEGVEECEAEYAHENGTSCCFYKNAEAYRANWGPNCERHVYWAL